MDKDWTQWPACFSASVATWPDLCNTHNTSVTAGSWTSAQRPTVVDERLHGTKATWAWVYCAENILFSSVRTPEVMSGGLCRYWFFTLEIRKEIRKPTEGSYITLVVNKRTQPHSQKTSLRRVKQINRLINTGYWYKLSFVGFLVLSTGLINDLFIFTLNKWHGIVHN